MFGIWCNNSRNPCVYLQPCLNNGTCFENISEGSGYVCQCQQAFQGIHCEVDRRPCQSFTCFERGTSMSFRVSCNRQGYWSCLFLRTGDCNVTSMSTFNCKCTLDYDGERCQSSINYCSNITCLNRGVCFSRYAHEKCLCLDRFYYGRRCEFLHKNTQILNAVSRGNPRPIHTHTFWFLSRSVSFSLGTGYLIIIVLVTFATFILLMDILKYVFGIDSVKKDRDSLSRKRRKKRPCKKRMPNIAIRFTYVPADDRQLWIAFWFPLTHSASLSLSLVVFMHVYCYYFKGTPFEGEINYASVDIHGQISEQALHEFSSTRYRQVYVRMSSRWITRSINKRAPKNCHRDVHVSNGPRRHRGQKTSASFHYF